MAKKIDALWFLAGIYPAEVPKIGAIYNQLNKDPTLLDLDR